MQEITLRFPWFDKVLNPNDRSHWAIKAKARKKQRRDAWVVAMAGKKPPVQDVYNLEVIFYPPDKHVRDRDNCLAACKGLFDGIASAWFVDDRTFKYPNPDFGDVVKNGEIVVRIK